ncbi:MAG: aldolase, partial [Bdellovibrionales bacterium]
MKTPNLNKFLVTRSPEVAMFAESCGVEVIFVDLETVGKADRQKNQGTPINSHSVEDAAKIKKKLKHAQLLTRINPLYKGSRTEIESVIDAGSDIIMIPFFSHPDDLKPLLEIIDGRAKVSLLFETPLSIFRFNHFLDELKFDEVHFGLNDLRILSGLDFLFETVSGGVLESAISE